MVRTQIQLGDAQAERLKRVARRNGLSMAGAVRQAVDGYLAFFPDDGAAKRERALSAIGAFEADPRLSQEHDQAAFAQEGG